MMMQCNSINKSTFGVGELREDIEGCEGTEFLMIRIFSRFKSNFNHFCTIKYLTDGNIRTRMQSKIACDERYRHL